MTIVSPSRPAHPRTATPRPAPVRDERREAGPRARGTSAGGRPGFVLYVGIDGTPDGEEIVELAETLSELARELLPDAETYTSVRLAEPRTTTIPRDAARTSTGDTTPGLHRDDVRTFHERLARVSGVPRLVIDAAAREVVVDDRRVHLTVKELDLLVHLARQGGRTVTREELLASVWQGAPVQEGTRTVDVHVRRLREKVDVGHVITTVRGVGYRFATTADVVLRD
ncbi:winged helix-turn-helix domain-containing protein [Luteimicrobium subarcticum]|uniref:Transcriptional regulator n=1 Tax=Luteimicrobium subarcticum TaxID=620910 RepID=A0A2M8W6R3_9MICO|nr:winged helix-turn-helix domain-containing protein [Luteimicrobium subarcticum]PJI86582.1 transcriptional regulator [Luteimicrobium subarcticum]